MRAAGAADRRPARPPRRAAGVARPRGGSRVAGRSSSRSVFERSRASGSANPPASCVGVSPRGSSSSASGFPRVSAMILSRTRSSNANCTDELSSARASPSTRPCTSRSGTCRSSSPGSRAANTSPTGSASSRRATNASVSAEVWSSHCASSTTHSRGRSLGHFGHQAEHGEADQETIRRRPRGQAEDDPERVTLWTRQPLEPIEQRRAQLMQAREGQLHLGLDPHRPRDGQIRRRLRPGTPAAPSSRCRPRPAGPATGSRRGGCRRQVVQQRALVGAPEEAHARPDPRSRLFIERDAHERAQANPLRISRRGASRAAHQGVDQGPHGRDDRDDTSRLDGVSTPAQRGSERRSS